MALSREALDRIEREGHCTQGMGILVDAHIIECDAAEHIKIHAIQMAHDLWLNGARLDREARFLALIAEA